MKTPRRYFLRNVYPVDCHVEGGLSDLLVWDGVIAAVAQASLLSPPEECLVLDGNGKTLLPAFVDLHVHFRDPV